MLIESRLVVSALFVSAVLLLLSGIAVLVGKSEAFERRVEWWRRQGLLKRTAVIAVLIGTIAYAGTKPLPGGGGDPSGTNVVETVEGGASTNLVDSVGSQVKAGQR